MLRYLTAALAVFVAIQSASADVSNEFKLTGFLTDLLSMMEHGIQDKAQEMAQDRVSKSKFTRIAEDFTRAIAKAAQTEGCSVTEAQELLKSSQAKFQESRKTCSSQCENYLAEAVQKIVADLQTADAAGAQQKAACGDDSCKLKVYEQTSESLMKTYTDAVPSIMAAIQQMRTSAPQCIAAITKCMITENGENLKKISDSLQTLRACLGESGDFGLPHELRFDNIQLH